jgi:dsDNA-binding SOS-regulon protein
MHGGPEQIHLEAWRTGAPLLQTAQADQALAQLKDFLSKQPVLMAPCKKEQLLLYLAATTHVVSTAIVVER